MVTSSVVSSSAVDDIRLLGGVQVRRIGPVRRFWAAHPRLGDVALVVVVVGAFGVVGAAVVRDTVNGIVALGYYPRGGAEHWVVPSVWLAGAVLGAGALLVRRRWPVVVLAVLTAGAVASLMTGGVTGVFGLCLGMAAAAVASSRDARSTWLLVTAAAVTVSAAMWWFQQIGILEMLLWTGYYAEEPYWHLTEPPFSPERRIVSVVLLVGTLLAGVLVGFASRDRRRHAHDIEERYRAVARERDTSAALVRTAERERLAREMHDVVAHSVSVMIALCDGAAAAFDRAPDASREALGELSRTGREALADMQRVLGALDTADATPQGAGLDAVVRRFRTAGMPVSAAGLDTPLPPDTALRLAVKRIVTEALTNVLRHAPGTSAVSVVVRRTGPAVEVAVVNEAGTGPGTGSGTERGIVGMRERVALLGGHMMAGPRAGGGWQVQVTLPCPDTGSGTAVEEGPR
ncbi:Nitrate/nitrite sensor protein NarX [Streptomyces sp. ADI98-12]|uniref:histidine kinase n=2 Tax=Streptomyces griseus group TaxID=629295 RepID=A0A380P9B3_STRGR|nr:Nitrate/nitrite sensor protein NarX [Streptomyces sp. ADI98-12]SUP61803.1 two component sensor kinase [Streptomyces griseus]